MKNCVNTSHKEFKELARKLDIEDSFLRTIIYEFQNADPTNVNVFPSEEYIIQKLTGINPITSPAQMALWEKYYFEVLKFDSEKKFNTALENAKKFFPSKAITTWKTRDGKIALKVAEPNNYRENLYEEDISEKNVNTKQRDLKLEKIAKNLKNIKGNKVLLEILKILKDSEYSSIIELMTSKFGDKKNGSLLDGISFKFIDPFTIPGMYNSPTMKQFDDRRAYYDASTKTIYINIVAEFTNGDSSAVLLHELMHAMTVDRILSNPELKAKFEQILEDYQKEHFDIRYANHKEHRLEEFIANIWSDPKTIENLKNTKSSRNSHKTLWQEIKDAISNIFSALFKDIKEDSLFAEASIELIKLLESPAIIKSSKSFKEEIQITYTPKGQEKQSFTVVDNKIYNKEGKEVYSGDNVHRNKILANVAVKQGNALVIPYGEDKYVVYKDGTIVSGITGKIMKWQENHGIRKYLTTEANKKFESKKEISKTTLTITPANSVDSKASVKGSLANKFIGFAEGIANSSTEKYRMQAGNMANVGIYTSDDVIFVSIPGKRGDRDTRIKQQNRTISEAIKAVESGATILTDNKEYIKNSDYNEGEKRLYETMQARGFYYEEINVEGTIIGSWKKQTTSLTITSTNNTTKKAEEIEITEIKEDTSTLEEPASELTPINIYAKTGENKNLSNFAPRPFDLNINSSNNIYLKELAGLIDDLGFNNVESAFHAAKILFTKEGIYWVEASGKKVLTKKGEELLETLMISSGDDALTTGRNIKGLDRTTWDNNSFNIMKSLLRISFSENENSLQELLATGESPLTHTQAKGRWKEDFPKALMEVREEFKRYKEIKPELIPEKTEYDEYIEESVKLANQISTLLNSEVINATDVREFADQVVYWISDEVTEILQNPSQFIGKYPNITEDNIEDIKNKSRIELIQLIGISNLLSECKKQFDPKHLNIKNIKAIRQALIIQQCWDGILHIASSTFADMEKFSIINNKNKLEVLENIDSVLDEFSDIQDKDNFEEIGNKQEHWQVEFRSIDVLNSMSQQVRFALSQCYILDNEGNRVRSIFNIAKRVSPRDAVNSILKWTQGSLNLKEMTNKLKEQLPTNPWLQQIINRLEDTSGNQTDFQSQFFSVFNKHYQSYYTVIKEKTKSGDFIYKSIPINTHPALKEATDSIIAMYTVGEHPLFLPSGVLNNSTYKDFKEIYEEIISLRNTSFDQIDKDALISKLKFIYNALGYYVTEDIIEKALNAEAFKTIYSNLTHMIKVMDQYKDRHDITPFTYKTSTSILGNVRKVLSPITDKLEDTMVSSFNDNGKMYQSYVTPSYMTKLMTKFKTSQETFENFLKEEFGKYKWFNDGNCFTDIREGWKNPWLHRMTRDPKARESFEHKVQLSFNKHNYMKTMNEVEYTLSILTEYWSESTSNSGSELAWFRVPMLSNKPSSEFIKFYSERGPLYKETLVKGFYQIALQELSRIQTVRIRNYSDTDASFIKSFDKNGRKFMFLDFLNDYLDGDKRISELGKLLNNKISGKELSAEDNNKLVTLLSKEIRDHMDQKAENLYMEWKNSGVIEGAKKIKGIGKTEEEIKENIINFIWNDTFASMNIIELTITDPAFYKDAEDLQKRFAQIHAPGVRGNTMATDYKGNPVTDGKHRTIYLTDFDNFKSNIIENLEVVFDRKIQEASEQQKPALRALKKNIIEQFESINVADAQAYSSPTSYRKKAFVFGKWNKKFEEIYEKLKKGEYNYSDLQTAFQPLKPFVYSQIEKSSKVDGPITKFKVPVQHKNSEYLLIMADAILQGENTGRPNLLRAVFDVMEKSTEVNPIKGIDTVQFESAVKSGLHGAIDIKQFQYTPGGELAAKELLESLMYNEDGSYNETFVHEIPYEDYCLQQEVPSHFKDHSQAHGSQIRYIIPSDLDTKDSEGNDITYNVEGKKLTASEFKQEYENTIADNIKQSIEDLSKELNLTGTRKERNVSLSKLLTREILNNPRYGTDLLLACSLDENGEFRIPLGDPIQSKRVEQLLNSIIKNKINKQTIAGGPIVQVSNFGTSKELNIRFKSKDGGLLMTRSEWEANKTNHSTFKEYIKDKQEGIAYFECFAPIGTDAIFEKFQNEDGSIDIKAIEALDPELLKLVGYRIPTEDKYSCVPLKIVGFLPREAGDGIMLPNDITLLSGSDFDVDKLYVMRKEIIIYNNDRNQIKESLYKELIKSFKNPKGEDIIRLESNIEEFLSDPEGTKNKDALFKNMWERYKYIGYKTEHPKEGRSYRNNKIVDMTYEILTHETTANKLLNPGGFEAQKIVGYAIEAYRNPKVRAKYSFEQLLKMRAKDIKNLCYTNKNLVYVDTQTQFYKQNNAAGSLIGTFAVHKIAHAVIEGENYALSVSGILGPEINFTIMGYNFTGLVNIDNTFNKNGEYIGKVLGSLVAASADAVKDPILNLMNINSVTAPILNTLVRMGVTFEDAALFLSQKCITDLLSEYSTENIASPISIGKFIEDKLEIIRKENNISRIDEIKSKNYNKITKKSLISGIYETSEDHEYKVLLAFNRLRKLSTHLKSPTFITRFNSISNAVGPQVIDNLIIENKIQNFSEYIYRNRVNVGAQDILTRHPILNQFFRTVNMAKFILNDIPINSIHFRNLLDQIPDNVKNTLMENRKSLSNFADFYLSTLLIANNVINDMDLEKYIKDFPKHLINTKVKEKYSNNLLINSLQFANDGSTGRVVIKINTSGLDTKAKELLGSSWTELYRQDSNLAIDLFKYCFFKGGIGFNPKTFMSLLPIFIREDIPGYKNTFVHPAPIKIGALLDQFIGNNSNNTSLVPKKELGEDFNAKYNKEKKSITISKKEDISKMLNVGYFKEKKSGIIYKLLTDVTQKEIPYLVYIEIPTLGNNGEYIEINKNYIKKAIDLPTEKTEGQNLTEIENMEVIDFRKTSSSDDAIYEDSKESPEEEQLRINELIDILLLSPKINTREEALEYMKKAKEDSEEKKKAKSKGIKNFLRKKIEEKTGKTPDESKVEEFYSLLCS